MTRTRTARRCAPLGLVAFAPLLAGCMLQQPLPRNLQPVLATPAVGAPNLNPTLSPSIIQDDALGLPPESLNSLPRGADVDRPLTPQAGEINNVRVGPALR